jgi:antitoxin (DNA-binding transcriptional repressor) of toxin-antitoxin stability system
MKTDTRDMVSATTAARDFSRISSEAAQGRTFVVVRNNEPTVAIVPVSQMERLDRIDELEDDMRILSVALARMGTDDGVRHSLDDVAAEFGVDLDD